MSTSRELIGSEGMRQPPDPSRSAHRPRGARGGDPGRHEHEHCWTCCLDLSEELKWQYETIYPLIIELMNREFPELDDNFVDLRAALDSDEYLYFDFCHLSPHNGNQLVAERISQSIAVRNGKVAATGGRLRARAGGRAGPAIEG